VLSVRNHNTTHEKDVIYSRFNDHNDPVDVLVLNMAVSAAGINFHRACWNGLVVMEGWNKPLTSQALGRIARIGQEETVDFRVLRIPNTYYDILEDKSNRKFVEQLRNECVMPAHLKYVRLQRLYAYELLTQYWGLPFNRYIWVILPPTKLTDYNCPGMRRAGSFLSTVVMRLVQMTPRAPSSPDANDGITEEEAADFAIRLERWIVKAAMRISMADDLDDTEADGAESNHVKLLDVEADIEALVEVGQQHSHAEAPF
jgi:hypothetical protein